MDGSNEPEHPFQDRTCEREISPPPLVCRVVNAFSRWTACRTFFAMPQCSLAISASRVFRRGPDVWGALRAPVLPLAGKSTACRVTRCPADFDDPVGRCGLSPGGPSFRAPEVALPEFTTFLPDFAPVSRSELFCPELTSMNTFFFPDFAPPSIVVVGNGETAPFYFSTSAILHSLAEEYLGPPTSYDDEFVVSRRSGSRVSQWSVDGPPRTSACSTR